MEDILASIRRIIQDGEAERMAAAPAEPAPQHRPANDANPAPAAMRAPKPPVLRNPTERTDDALTRSVQALAERLEKRGRPVDIPAPAAQAAAAPKPAAAPAGQNPGSLLTGGYHSAAQAARPAPASAPALPKAPLDDFPDVHSLLLPPGDDILGAARPADATDFRADDFFASDLDFDIEAPQPQAAASPVRQTPAPPRPEPAPAAAMAPARPVAPTQPAAVAAAPAQRPAVADPRRADAVDERRRKYDARFTEADSGAFREVGQALTTVTAKALVSDTTSREVGRAFGDLSAAMRGPKPADLDAMAQAMLKPMLQEWLDENLPGLVERLVREEIERVARGGR